VRYEIIIKFKGANSAEFLPVKRLKEVNDWLAACIDDTVHSVDVRDRIRMVAVTYTGTPIDKSSFIL